MRLKFCDNAYLLVLENQRFKSVKACRPKARQANVKRKFKCEQFKVCLRTTDGVNRKFQYEPVYTNHI
ncbi:MAG: hypothetical protein LBP59_09345 [Planctomycetaceae bacterium]|nr:hypothetical protein [Planctomycetaceae bacterium]